MSKIRGFPFLFSGNELHDASQDAVSEALELCFNHHWSLFPAAVSLDGSPLWTMEVSDNLIDWAPYDDLMENAAIDQPFDDDHFAWKYARIVYTAADNTTGTVSFKIFLKSL